MFCVPRPGLSLGNGSAGVGTTVITSGSPLVANTLQMVGIAFRYNSATSRDFIGYVGGISKANNYTSPSWTPSASAASTQTKYGLATDGTFMASGRRTYGLTMFNRLLSQAEFDALRASFQRRWPTI